MKKMMIALLAISLIATGCQKKEEISGLTMQNSFPFVSVAKLFNSYPVKVNGDLEQFEGLVLGETTASELDSILLPRGYKLSPIQGFDDGFEDFYYEGYLNGIEVEYGLYFTNHLLTSISFNVANSDKVAFMTLIAEQYGRPRFDEEKSNSYIWEFTNCAIVFHQQPAEGLVEIHLFSAIYGGLK